LHLFSLREFTASKLFIFYLIMLLGNALFMYINPVNATYFQASNIFGVEVAIYIIYFFVVLFFPYLISLTICAPLCLFYKAKGYKFTKLCCISILYIFAAASLLVNIATLFVLVTS